MPTWTCRLLGVLLCLCLRASVAQGAITIVQAIGCDNGAGAANLTCSFAATTTGNTLIVHAWNPNGTALSASKVSDDKSQTWTTDADVSLTGGRTQIAHMENTVSGVVVVTIHEASSTVAVCIMIEVSGLATSSDFDKNAQARTAAVTAWNSGNTTTTAQANELLFGTSADGNGSRAYTVGASYTQLTGTGLTSGQGHRDTTDGDGIFGEYQIVSSTGTYAASGTTSVSSTQWSQISTWKQASGGGATRGLFQLPNLTGMGIGGSFFGDPLALMGGAVCALVVVATLLIGGHQALAAVREIVAAQRGPRALLPPSTKASLDPEAIDARIAALRQADLEATEARDRVRVRR